MLSHKQLLSLLTLNRRDIITIIIFAMTYGLLSLVVPIAAQGVVTIVSFGTVRQPLFVLVIVVFVLLTFSSVTRLLQNILIETIQQRIFASSALKIASRLPQIKLVTLDDNHGSEILNKYFDIMTIQKTLSSLIPALSGFILQASVGMILFALYHPVLIVYDLIFIISVSLIIFLPYQSGLDSAITESNAKYDVAAWLEEMARVAPLFHFHENGRFGFDRADDMVVTYLKARKSHFQSILKHMVSAYGLQILVSSSLFLIGGLLVLNNQMTLGQLVAAEIIATALGASAAKIPNYMEKYYDLRAAAEKVHKLITIPVDESDETTHLLITRASELVTPPTLEVKKLLLPNLSYDNEISFNVVADSSAVVLMNEQMSKNILADCLLGLREAISGEIIYNDIPVMNYHQNKFRKKVSLIRNLDYFDGTLLDNITMGDASISIDEVTNILRDFTLLETIQLLPDKLNYVLSGSTHPFSNSQFIKLQFIREILTKPMLMVIDEALDSLTKSQAEIIISEIKKHCRSLTLIVLTRKKTIANLFDNRIEI